MLEQLIENRLAVLNPDYRAFIEGDFPENTANLFGEVHSFNQKQLDALENAITLYLLLIFSKEQAVSFISDYCEISKGTALELFLGIQSALPKEITSAINTGFAIINIPTDPETTQLASEIAETEKEFAAIQGIRTMAGDMHHAKNPGEVIYSSSQAELLNRTTPTRSAEAGSRWDTDR